MSNVGIRPSPLVGRVATGCARCLGLAGLFVWSLAPAAPAGTDLVPVARSAQQRVQAVAFFSGGGAVPVPCLTPLVESARGDGARASALTRKFLSALVAEAALTGERRIASPAGHAVRFTIDRTSPDRIEPVDGDGNGRPDVVDAALAGVTRVEALLNRQLELPHPGPIEIVMSRLGSGVEGTVGGTTRDGHVVIGIDSASRGGSATVRRAVTHQYAHLVGSAAGLSPAWSEALATWTNLNLDPSPDDRALAAIDRRLQALGSGLPTEEFSHAAGNAAWFAFLDQAYGSTAVKLTVEELGRGGSTRGALDRALRRSAGESVDGAFRDFQLWSLLTGLRDDGRHFRFASRLHAPTFTADADALPYVSVQEDPAVAPLGAAAILLRPGPSSGGMLVRFEGDLAARWAVDLLLVKTDGGLHRVPVALDADDAGEITVPLHATREAILLVRNLDEDGRAARRYTWTAHHVPGFPAEIESLRAESTGPGTASISWDAIREIGAIGFNVMRSASDDRPGTRINPVWIPAVGDAGSPASYSFLDTTVQRGTTYVYRVEVITAEGLTSRSAPERLVTAP